MRPRRLLLVTSSYAPTMIADMHRVRHLAWELPALGWELDVLAPGTGFQRPEYVDPASWPLFNPDVICHEVEPRDSWSSRLLGKRSMNWRALWPLYRAGAGLLKKKRFDLIYISTTKFNLFCLGRFWQRKFGVPYVLDFHDPWVREYSNYKTTRSAWKQRLSTWLARPMEAFAIRGASGIVSVSPVYVEALRRRHGALDCLLNDRCKSIPFAASERDLLGPAAASHITPTEQKRTLDIVYVGAGGAIMARSFETICLHLQALRQTEHALVDRVRIRLYGTYAMWMPGDPKPLHELAARHGLSELVCETPPWIGYKQTMELLRMSDGLFVLGVDDAAYVPSKLFTYALSGKPLLACFRADSPAPRFFDEIPGLGNLLTFSSDGAMISPEGVVTMRTFLREVEEGRSFDRSSSMAGYLAAGMARRHADLFNHICGEHHERTPAESLR